MAVAVALAVVAFLLVSSRATGSVIWTPDALFYQERVLTLRGASEAEAHRAVFESDLSAELRSRDQHQTGSPTWIRFNKESGFYERRLVVPLAAAAIYPVFQERSLLVVSIIGYVIAVVLAFVLSRLHFSLPVACATALLTALLPPLRSHASFPLTDSVGVALSFAAVICAVLTIRHGLAWLPAWVIVLVAAGFTRDSAWVIALGVAWLALRSRERTHILLAASGICAVALAPLIYSVPLLETMAFVVSGLQPPPEVTWWYVAQHWPGSVVELVRANGGFLRRGEWYTTAFFAVGIVALFTLRPKELLSQTATMLRGACFAGLAFLLVLPNFTAFRLELVFVPMAAFGLAALTHSFVDRSTSRRPTTPGNVA